MTDAIRYAKDHDNIVVLTLDMPGQSANTMNADYRAAMEATLDRLEAEQQRIAGAPHLGEEDLLRRRRPQ